MAMSPPTNGHSLPMTWSYVKFSDKLNVTFFAIILPASDRISPFDPDIFFRTDPETDIHNGCARGLYCKTYLYIQRRIGMLLHNSVS